MAKKEMTEKDIVIIENSAVTFETGNFPNRNEINVIDGIYIANPLQAHKSYRRY